MWKCSLPGIPVTGTVFWRGDVIHKKWTNMEGRPEETADRLIDGSGPKNKMLIRQYIHAFRFFWRALKEVKYKLTVKNHRKKRNHLLSSGGYRTEKAKLHFTFHVQCVRNGKTKPLYRRQALGEGGLPAVKCWRFRCRNNIMRHVACWSRWQQWANPVIYRPAGHAETQQRWVREIYAYADCRRTTNRRKCARVIIVASLPPPVPFSVINWNNVRSNKLQSKKNTIWTNYIKMSAS